MGRFYELAWNIRKMFILYQIFECFRIENLNIQIRFIRKRSENAILEKNLFDTLLEI